MNDRGTGRDTFARAYSSLRGELARATRPPGSQIRVDETARALSISPTPVREALSRLGGERLVHGCRRQGYFVPRYSGPELAQLYRLLECHLKTALAEVSSGAARAHRFEQVGGAASETSSDIGRILVGVIASTGQGLLVDAGALLVERLAPARRVEGDVIDIRDESRRLREVVNRGQLSEMRSAIAAYHRIRISNADAIAALLRPPRASGLEYIPDIV